MNHLPTTANNTLFVPPVGPDTSSSRDFLKKTEQTPCRSEDIQKHSTKLAEKTCSNPVKESDNQAVRIKKLSPDYENSIYDSLRPCVSAILNVSSKFQLKSSRTKGAVLICGEPNTSAEEKGFGLSILPLKARSGGPGFYVDNSLIVTLGKYARQQDREEEPVVDDDLPELILGLCCNNWGMCNGRNALIEAMLEILGSEHRSKLSIHSAIYALEFNTRALRDIILPSEQEAATVEEEHSTRIMHANAFAASAETYGLDFDSLLEGRQIDGVSKKAFAEELSQATIEAVERTLSSATGRHAIDLVLQMMKHRRLIQDNMTNKRFRRQRSQNDIEAVSRRLKELFSVNFQARELELAEQLPGWQAYVKTNGGTASAVLGLMCHSLDVLAGCVARSKAEITPDVAERLVLTVLTKENRLMEYTANQVYELMSPPEQQQQQQQPPRMYIYRRPGDLLMFSTMPCGVVEMGGKL